MKKIILGLMLSTVTVTAMATLPIEGEYHGRYTEFSNGNESGNCKLNILKKRSGKIKVILDLENRNGEERISLSRVPKIEVDSDSDIQKYIFSKRKGGNPEISQLCDSYDFCLPWEKNITITVVEKNGVVDSASFESYPVDTRAYRCQIN